SRQGCRSRPRSFVGSLKGRNPMSETTTKAPSFLNDDGSVSMATMFLTAHHGFRRDIALFGTALRSAAAAGPAPRQAPREEWEKFRAPLHGHHVVEDTSMFPGLKSQNPGLAPVIERLDADHRRIDPLLERGDRAFAGLPGSKQEA